MLRVDRIKAAVDDVMAAALLGDGWEQALAGLSYASGAHGAVLMRNRAHHMLAAITTEEMAESVKVFAAGHAPPNSRYSRVRHDRAGFRIDHDDYTDEELARDPFYQEFLRPAGYFWHANVALTIGRDEFVELSLKRRHQAGPYQRADAVGLDAVVPDLLVAARLAKYTLDAEARGMARLLQQRGAPVLELDAWGRVLSRHAAPEDPACPLHVIGRRLVAIDPAAQPALDRAVARVLAIPDATALVPLDRAAGPTLLPAAPARTRARARHLPLGCRTGCPDQRRAAAADSPRRRDRRARLRAHRPRSGRRLPARRGRDARRCRAAPWHAGRHRARSPAQRFRQDRDQPPGRARRAARPPAAVEHVPFLRDRTML